MKCFFSLLLVLSGTVALSAQDADFLIDDVFSITGRGIVLAGELRAGTISSGDRLLHVSASGRPGNTYTISELEQFRRSLKTTIGPGHYGIVIRGARVLDFSRGDRLTTAPPVMDNLFFSVTSRIDGGSRGTLAIGTIASGGVHVGDEVDLIGNGYDRRRTTVTYIERDRVSVNATTTGENIGLVLAGVLPNQLPYGIRVVSPGTGRVGNYLEIDVFTSAEIKLSGSNEIEVRGQFTPAEGVPAHVLLGVGLLEAPPRQRLILKLFLTRANYYRNGDRISLFIDGESVASGTIISIGE